MSTTEVLQQYSAAAEQVCSKEKKGVAYQQLLSSVSERKKLNFFLQMNSDLNTWSKTGDVFNFITGNPNPSTIPFTGLTIDLKDGSEIKMNSDDVRKAFSLKYIDGYPPLINLLKTFQDQLHGQQNWMEKDIIITSGIQDGVCKTLDSYMNDGDVIILQATTFFGTLWILENKNFDCLEAECDSYGICPKYLSDMLERRRIMNLKMPKFLYVVPTGGNPLSTNLSIERKKIIYDLACKYNFIILEDDPYFLLNFEGIKTSTSFLSLDTDGRVVRFDSFSKTIGLGLRLGYITATKEMIRPINLISQLSNVPSTLSQVLLHKTLEKMGYDGFLKLVSETREFYSQNCQIMLRSLEKHFKDIAEWVRPEGGLFIWIKIKNLEHISREFVDACVKKCVFYLPGALFFNKSRSTPHIRLSYSLPKETEIEKGVELLATLIKEQIIWKSKK